MITRVKTYVGQQNMWNMGDHIIAGISGGADSVCLFLMLLELQKEWNLRLTVVHVHHGLRGSEADADEAFVRELCEKHEVAFRSFRVDAAAEAARRKISEEEAGRELRREIFEQVRREEEADRIAVAHHRNDNVETFLFRLCRGSGLEGLCGMKPVNDRIVRPLLCLDRREIEAYLQEKGQSYCVDRTNAELVYSRNRIRRELIPYMEKELNQRTVEHISDTMEDFREIQEYMETELEKIEKDCVTFGEGTADILEEGYRKLPKILQRRLLKQCLIYVAGRQRDIARVHVQVLEELMDLQCGRQIDLPYHVAAQRNYEGIHLAQSANRTAPITNVTGHFPMELPIPCEEGAVRARVFFKPANAIILEKTHTKWFDYDIIKRNLQIRTRKSGDYLVVDRNGSRQKLKSYFVNAKIPKEERDRLLVVAEGSHVLWVIGYRMSMAYQVTEETRRILEIRIAEDYENV